MLTTRQRLIDAATEAFAEHGILTASLVEITRQADQRNRGAVHYHFKGRDGLLVAVLEQHADFLAVREGELLALARKRPATDVASVIDAIVRPTLELAEKDKSGRDYLRIIAELTEMDPASRSAEVDAAVARTGGYAVFDVLTERVPELDEELRGERYALMTVFIMGSVARRARAMQSLLGGRAQLPTPTFAANLTAMATAMLTAPVVDA